MSIARVLVAAVLVAAATAGPAATSTAGPAGVTGAVGQLLPAIRVGLRGGGKHRKSHRKSAADAAREARRRYGGRVLSVRREGDSYRVRIIKNGTMRVVTIPVQ